MEHVNLELSTDGGDTFKSIKAEHYEKVNKSLGLHLKFDLDVMDKFTPSEFAVKIKSFLESVYPEKSIDIIDATAGYDGDDLLLHRFTINVDYKIL